MADTCCWYETRIPENLFKNLLSDIENIDENSFIKSEINLNESSIHDNIRKSQHCWIPSTHWIGRFIWKCIMYPLKN